MKHIALAVSLFIFSFTHAQVDTSKAPIYGWTHSMVAGLTLSQIAFTDWTQGGDNALSWVIAVDGKSVNDQEVTNWTSTYKFAFGQARLGNAGLRKTEDKIELESVITYKLNQHVNPYGAATFKSQFAKGYKYPAGVETAVSKFFDPAYLTQSVGAGWQPIQEVKTRLGVALREVIADAYAGLYTDDPATAKVEKSKVEGGLESVSDVEWKMAENILLTAKLELFAPFKKIDRVDLRGDTKVTMTVNKYISAMFSVQVLNIEPFPRTQLKESISLGFTYNVF
ncbi:MAG: DUF3078 domain-containing protein [Ignavibacteriae bacterium]|nr:DUF3078 domain-containing protein [Ignavibacteriota bacterium]